MLTIAILHSLYALGVSERGWIMAEEMILNQDWQALDGLVVSKSA